MKKLLKLLYCLILVFGLSGTAKAALWDRGNNLIYDDDLHITWYDFTYHSFPETGIQPWQNAVDWADSLDYGGFDDWRLPTTPLTGTPGNYNITSGEMGHLFYIELQNFAYDSNNPGWGLQNTGPFTNLDKTNLSIYWYGTTDTEWSTGYAYAYYFNFYIGMQGSLNKSLPYYALAVRDGDVVPIPSTIILFYFGILGLAGVSRRAR